MIHKSQKPSTFRCIWPRSGSMGSVGGEGRHMQMILMSSPKEQEPKCPAPDVIPVSPKSFADPDRRPQECKVATSAFGIPI